MIGWIKAAALKNTSFMDVRTGYICSALRRNNKNFCVKCNIYVLQTKHQPMSYECLIQNDREDSENHEVA